jgi:chemotaxis protein methyltransferase CheR
MLTQAKEVATFPGSNIGNELTISDVTFTRYQTMLYRNAGIWLNASKKPLLLCRLSKRLRQLDVRSFDHYFRVITSDPDERSVFFNLITTNETHFFREPRQFEYLEDAIIPDWKQLAADGKRSKTLNIWSAGCSSGEEPYSILMLLLQHFPLDSGWTIRILATDISTRVLQSAQEGIYRIERAKDVPAPFLKKFMLKGHGNQSGMMCVKPELKPMIEFRHLNLNDGDYQLGRSFDLVFCRNVLIYFNQESKTQVIHRLVSHIAPGGRLFLGHAENLAGIAEPGCSVSPNVYLISKEMIRNSSGSV